MHPVDLEEPDVVAVRTDRGGLQPGLARRDLNGDARLRAEPLPDDELDRVVLRAPSCTESEADHDGESKERLGRSRLQIGHGGSPSETRAPDMARRTPTSKERQWASATVR